MKSEYVCKHCGSDDIVAEVERKRSGEVPGKIRERNGQPYFDEDPLSTFDWDDDFDVIEYVCECGESNWKLEKLVIKRQAYEQLQLPCGRCDHHATDHELKRGPQRDGFVRPPMPCTVPGCDCHDFYDVAIATARIPNGQLELAA